MNPGDKALCDPAQEARHVDGVGGGEKLLEEIRGRIWSNTGCSDDAAEQAAAAVYDLFLDQKAAFPDLLDALGRLERPAPGVKMLPPWAVGIARAAIAKAEGRS